MSTTYEKDIVAWSQEQAKLLRSGQFSVLDVEHIADEIEDVGKSEQRELSNRMASLLSHLLKWEFQPERRGASWEAAIHARRNSIEQRIRKTPSLKALLADPDWWVHMSLSEIIVTHTTDKQLVALVFLEIDATESPD